MLTFPATTLKNRLGLALKAAAVAPVAITRHGRVIALLVPPRRRQRTKIKPDSSKRPWGRNEEQRLIKLVMANDFRPSRWRRAGDPHTLAGIATMLASVSGFDRARMLALAECLNPGISAPAHFSAWLKHTPVHAARLLPQIKMQRSFSHHATQAQA